MLWCTAAVAEQVGQKRRPFVALRDAERRAQKKGLGWGGAGRGERALNCGRAQHMPELARKATRAIMCVGTARGVPHSPCTRDDDRAPFRGARAELALARQEAVLEQPHRDRDRRQGLVEGEPPERRARRMGGASECVRARAWAQPAWLSLPGIARRAAERARSPQRPTTRTAHGARTSFSSRAGAARS